MNKKNNLFRLELLILSVLKQKDCYGYEICAFIKLDSKGMFDIKEGVMYPILYNLVENNYITSYEKIVNRKIRVFYHIEESGLNYLHELDDEFQKKLVWIQGMLKGKTKNEREK